MNGVKTPKHLQWQYWLTIRSQLTVMAPKSPMLICPAAKAVDAGVISECMFPPFLGFTCCLKDKLSPISTQLGWLSPTPHNSTAGECVCLLPIPSPWERLEVVEAELFNTKTNADSISSNIFTIDDHHTNVRLFGWKPFVILLAAIAWPWCSSYLNGVRLAMLSWSGQEPSKRQDVDTNDELPRRTCRDESLKPNVERLPGRDLIRRPSTGPIKGVLVTSSSRTPSSNAS